MAKITLAPNPAGSGTLIISAPNTNINSTITLPNETTTLIGTKAATALAAAMAIALG